MERARTVPGARLRALICVSAAAFAALPATARAQPPSLSIRAQSSEDEAEIELARKAADRARRRGDRAGLRVLNELVDEEPSDARSRTLLALFQRDLGEWTKARDNAAKAYEDAAKLSPDVRAECARNWAWILLDLGETQAAQDVLQRAAEFVDARADARNAWVLGRTSWLLGRRDAARELFRAAETDASSSWERLLDRARCERALGDLVRASASLLAADEAAEAGEGREPDVLAETASVFFEADGELDHPEAKRRGPGEVYRKALAIHKTHEPTLLGLFELGRFNWNRQSRPAHEILSDLLAAKPKSIEGLLAGASADIDDGRMVAAREKMEELRALAPKRRELRTLDATLAWVEHHRDECERLLGALHAEDAADSRPQREIARHLSELYRFAEAVPFAQAAVERDANDYLAFTELGRALSNTGDEEKGLEALRKSEELAAGRQNAWRHNSILVLDRIHSKFVKESGSGQLSYAWAPQAADVLRTYWMPFYSSAREELAQRYSFTPGPTTIEVFERFQDFSVRSTGFEGFPALGVCFGPVVTSVAPHSELRGKFSWARTSFHEFTHVIHLGLSHNRCPRWITEGLATWEEENKNPAWTRNMRRDLLDAYYNGDLIPVRDLNRAFRSQRILFGYFMSGQLCRMWIEKRGFTPMIRLLEAFDQGQDLDQALRTVFGTTPEQTDQEFHDYVQRTIAPLQIEPRWTLTSVAKRKLSLPSERPSDPAGAEAWAEGWCDVAWGYYQNGKRVDAEQALRKLAQTSDLPKHALARSLFLGAEMALQSDDMKSAKERYEAAFGIGGEDYRARMALGKLALDDEEWEEAEKHFLAAEKAFPGYGESGFSAEMHLAQVYEHLEREDDQYSALERSLAWNSDDYKTYAKVAKWHADKGRPQQADRYFQGANQIDPFRRDLHSQWGRSLSKLARHEEALREFRVTLLVPPELDLDDPEPFDDARRAEMLGLQAVELIELGRTDEARTVAEEALKLDKDEKNALGAIERLGGRRS